MWRYFLRFFFERDGDDIGIGRTGIMRIRDNISFILGLRYCLSKPHNRFCAGETLAFNQAATKNKFQKKNKKFLGTAKFWLGHWRHKPNCAVLIYSTDRSVYRLHPSSPTGAFLSPRRRTLGLGARSAAAA